MEHVVGIGGADGRGEAGKVGQIRTVIHRKSGCEVELAEKEFVRLGIQGVAMNFGTQLQEPLGEPRSLEAGMSSEEHPLAGV